MKRKFALAAAATLLSGGMAYADAHAASGDAAAGEAVFRQCAACHNVVNDAGDVLAGRPNMRTGPNLYGDRVRPSATSRISAGRRACRP
jgi:cytochrome c